MDRDDEDENILVTSEPGSLGTLVFTEEPAPVDDRCDEVLHVGPTGIWMCQRWRGHDGGCWATGVIELPDDEVTHGSRP